MKRTNGPVIDMTPEGEFLNPPRPGILSYALRLALFGIALAAIALLLRVMVFMALLFILAGAVAYAFFRPRITIFRMRR